MHARRRVGSLHGIKLLFWIRGCSCLRLVAPLLRAHPWSGVFSSSCSSPLDCHKFLQDLASPDRQELVPQTYFWPHLESQESEGSSQRRLVLDDPFILSRHARGVVAGAFPLSRNSMIR